MSIEIYILNLFLIKNNAFYYSIQKYFWYNSLPDMRAILLISKFFLFIKIYTSKIKEIINIHLGYLKAGSDIIITNTLNSTPTKLEFHGLQNKIKEINENAVSAVNESIDIYRTTSGDSKPIFIAGDIGPLGKLLDPFGPLKYEEALDSFSEQADILIGKVALIAIEK